MNIRAKHIILIITALLSFSQKMAGVVNVKNGTHIYSDTTIWNYSHYYFAVGSGSSDATLFTFSVIENTKVLYCAPTEYNNAGYFCLFATAYEWNTGASFDYMRDNGENITWSYTNYNFNSGNYYFVKPSKHGSKYDLANVEPSHKGTSYDFLNHNQTVRAYISTDGGTSYRETSTWPGSIHANKYTFTSASAVTNTPEQTITYAQPTTSAAYTSFITLSESITDDDYIFAGWFTTNGDTLSTDANYTYEVSGETTVCAYFHQKPHISLEVIGKGTTPFNPSSRITVTPTLTGLVRGTNYIVCYDFIEKPGGASTNIIRKDNSNDVIVSGNSLGDYTIQAVLKEGTDCEGEPITSATESFTIEQYVMLHITGSHSKGGTVTLDAITSLSDAEYHFTVIDADNGTPQPIAGAISSASRTYQLDFEGEYTFSVTIEGGGGSITATDYISWSAVSSKYLRYPFPNAMGNDRIWRNVEMSYDANTGLYHYYSDSYPISSYESDSDYKHGSTGANILDENTEDTEGKKYLTIETNGLSSSMEPRIFTYDPVIDLLYLQKADTTKYRIKSICGNKTYYSNTFISFGSGGTTVSFFATFDGQLFWQKSTDSGITWNDESVITTTIPKDGVFTATATAATANGLTNLHEYTGDFKIYGVVTQDTTNVMAQFENITKEEFYNHYWCKWIGSSANTYATVGNSINHCLADRKVDYEASNTNIRFAYNPTTNYFSRTFLAGSDDAEFLRIYGDNVYKPATETQPESSATVLNDAIKFSDGSDWTYSVDIKAGAGTNIVIAAKYTNPINSKNTITYVLSEKGLESDKLNILGAGSNIGGEKLPFHIIYDYKTNRVIAAWVPSSGKIIETPITVDADLLVYRNAHNTSEPNILRFTDAGQATILRRIIFALDIDRDQLFNSNKTPKYGNASYLFQVTLPYEADLTSVHGLANYGTDWVIQDYKGEIRAKVGWQGDGVSDFWTTLLWRNGTKLRKGRGYVVSTNFEYNDFKVIGSLAKKTLFFPSPYNAEGYKLDNHLPDAMMYTELKCTIKGREPYDSNWRCIGPTSFYPVYAVAENINYFYRWDGTHNSYTALEAATEPMQPTHNYIVQYSGIIGWANSPATPAPSRTGLLSQSSSTRYRLDIKKDSTTYDYAYIHLSPTGTEDYVIGKDLLKILSSTKPQIYTLTRDNELAANHLSDTTSRVIIGTNLPSNDSCTISLGRRTAGSLSPILFDAQTNIYTNLAETDYTFCGTAGQDEERFTLFFGQTPQQGTSMTATCGTSLHACIADGQIIINSDQPLSGTIRLYDAAGRLISAGAASSASAHLPAPSASGIYLIQAGNAATRIIIP